MNKGECSTCKTSLNRLQDQCGQRVERETEAYQDSKENDWRSLKPPKYSDSKILKCEFKDQEGVIIHGSNKSSWAGARKKLHHKIGREKVLGDSKMNVVVGPCEENKYIYDSELDLYMVNKNSYYTLDEIIYQVKKHKYSVDLEIKLTTEQTIHIILINGIYQ